MLPTSRYGARRYEETKANGPSIDGTPDRLAIVAAGAALAICRAGG
jgi:hypothetical protein